MSLTQAQKDGRDCWAATVCRLGRGCGLFLVSQFIHAVCGSQSTFFISIGRKGFANFAGQCRRGVCPYVYLHSRFLSFPPGQLSKQKHNREISWFCPMSLLAAISRKKIGKFCCFKKLFNDATQRVHALLSSSNIEVDIFVRVRSVGSRERKNAASTVCHAGLVCIVG